MTSRLALALLGLVLLGNPSPGAEPAAPVSFRDQVAPILVRKCLGCHNAKKPEGGLDMTTFAALKKGGDSGGELILEPGDPDASQLVELVRPGAAPRMPYKQKPLAADEIRTLELWVKYGAAFDGPSEAETPIASLVDPLRDLPRVAVKVPMPEAVTALAYAPDGKTLAAATGRSVLLHDAATGRVVATLADHPGPLTDVKFTPDGKALVAVGGRAGLFGSVVVWDVATRARRAELRGHRDAILSAAIAPDGRTLATAGYDRQVLLWDLEAGKEARALKDHTDAVYAVAFSPDGRSLASAAGDRTVKLWEVATGRRVATLSDATAELYTLAFAPDGRTVLAAGVDRSIRAWNVADKEAPLAGSVFAHDAAILRLVVSPDGKTLASSGEDRDVKLWQLPTLKPRAALDDQADWPQGLAISPDGSRIAVGRYDGSLSIYEAATGKSALAMKKTTEPARAAKPELVRNATLGAPSPRGGVRGSTLRVTLSGNGVGRATAVVFAEPGLSAAIVPARKPAPNRLEVDLTIAPDARVGVHRIGVVTPLGVPASQAFAVSAFAEAAEAEPNDDPARAKEVSLPATLLGTIERPGDVDHIRFRARAGDELVFQTLARPLGSALLGVLSLVDDQGRTVAEAMPREGSTDPLLTCTIPRDGVYILRVADADYGGSGNHFYRIAAGMLPYLTDVFPLGVERGQTTTLRVSGLNLRGTSSVTMPVPVDAPAGEMRVVPVGLADGAEPINRRTVVVADGRQSVEAEGNDEPARAEPIAAPGGISARIDREGDVDHFRFEAKKGRRVIVEVFGRRLGGPIDPAIDVLDAKGRPIPRAVLRPVDQTETVLRDHDSTKPGIRIARWNNLAVNDDVLIGRELARIEALPRNPDDDCIFWSEEKQRIAFLETTPEHHPVGQPVYKVEVHPPGTTFPPGGVPPVTLTYRNDDGGPAFAEDSRVTFDPPADGTYVVRVEDVSGRGGEAFGYHLVVRAPRPDFRVTLGTENPNIPRGGTTLVTASVTRLDGFDGAVEVRAEDLPPGITATPAVIEPGDFTASLALSADATAPAFSPPTWRATARALGGSSASQVGSERVHRVDPGGPEGGRITVTPAPNLEVVAAPRQVAIRPGEQVTMRLSVRRGPAFAGRVPIEVRNLPPGVRVLNIGLNGVLITEKQSERTVSLYAEPWAAATERPFYAVGKAEAAATEHSSPPVVLIVNPGPATSADSTAARPR